MRGGTRLDGSELADGRRLKLPVVIGDRGSDLLVAHDIRHIGVIAVDGESDGGYDAADDDYYHTSTSRAVTPTAFCDQRKDNPCTLENTSGKASFPKEVL